MLCMYQSWIEEVHDVGFAGVSSERRCQIPTCIRTISELSNLATKLIFASTCQHSATHTEALDLYGFVPGVPAMMRAPPMTRRHNVTKEVFSRTLPDQFPDAYYGSLATVLQIHRPEEVSLWPFYFFLSLLCRGGATVLKVGGANFCHRSEQKNFLTPRFLASWGTKCCLDI